jgi:16S rRNA (guanine527-N7)-methyltransferase
MVFHVEQTKTKKLFKYAELIHDFNQKKNITGFSTAEEIYNQLILTSFLDLDKFNVPRGTLFADLGSGNGVPGLVLGIMFPQFDFHLVDSNQKKCSFMKDVCEKMSVTNVEVYNSRVEDFAVQKRSLYGFVISRAFGPLLYSCEYGLSLLKKDGFLYIFSKKSFDDLSDVMKVHVKTLGGVKSLVNMGGGIVLQKSTEMLAPYPRKFTILKRESKRIPEFKDSAE